MRRSLPLLLAIAACSGPPAPEKGVDTTLNEVAEARPTPSTSEVASAVPASSEPMDSYTPEEEARVDRGELAPMADAREPTGGYSDLPRDPFANTPRVSQAAGLRGNPGQYFGADNYPPAAIRAGAEGRTVARLTVGTDGRVSECEVSSTSGNEDLDSTTCRIARSRIRFSPARDDSGEPISSTYILPVRWVLPADAAPPPATE